MGYKIIDISLGKVFDFGFFEDAEQFFKEYRFENRLSVIEFVKVGPNSAQSTIVKYYPNEI